jgi:hypothetical protein
VLILLRSTVHIFVQLRKTVVDCFGEGSWYAVLDGWELGAFVPQGGNF